MPLTTSDFAFVCLPATPFTPSSAVPESCRYDSINNCMPYMPEWLNERPPPFVFTGNLPPGPALPSAHRLGPSPRGVRPSISAVIPAVTVNES